MQNTMLATLVAAEIRPYNTFTDKSGVQRPPGNTYRLWLTETFESQPIDVRCTVEQFGPVKALGAGAQVSACVEVGASVNFGGTAMVTFRLVSLEPAVSPVQKPVLASNGQK